MSQEIAKPETRRYWRTVDAGNEILHTGYTEPEQVTTTGQDALTAFASESELLGDLQDAMELIPAMPTVGEELQQGEIYQYNDTLYMVRQTHRRTEHDPSIVPALFLVYNPAGTDWIAGESVAVGAIRNHGSKTWEAIQAHVTQSGWEPANVPALWREVIDEPEIPDWIQPTGGHDAYSLGAIVRHNGQVWENTGSAANVWEPGVFGWTQVQEPE